MGGDLVKEGGVGFLCIRMPAPSDFNRRRFLLASLTGSAVPGALRSAEEAKKEGLFTEPAQEIPLANDADVIVCGAGPAGVAAAITAARAGAKVRLFEWRGCLGGIWTAGLRWWTTPRRNR